MNSDAIAEKRRFHRIIYNADATLTGNGSVYGCKVVDLSLRGCLLRLEQPWSGNADHLYTLTLNLSAEDSITMELAISHIDGNRIGLKCERIDIDSISNLHRLLELNLGDSELLLREFAALTDTSF